MVFVFKFQNKSDSWLVPADVVSFTDPKLGQTVGFVLVVVRTGRYDGLSASLSTGRVRAGTEEQLVGVVGRNPIEELPQSFVTPGSVTGSGASRGLDAGRHVLGAELLTGLVNVAGFSSVQAAVHRRHLGL